MIWKMIDLDLDLKDVKKVLNFLSFDDRLEIILLHVNMW